MKSQREHRVPLSYAALAVLEDVRPHPLTQYMSYVEARGEPTLATSPRSILSLDWLPVCRERARRIVAEGGRADHNANSGIHIAHLALRHLLHAGFNETLRHLIAVEQRK